jgi:FKBP-type peptidyl-prolyl cis-trans isomerase
MNTRSNVSGSFSFRTLFVLFGLAGLVAAGCKESPTEPEDLPELPQPRFVEETDYTRTANGLKYHDFIVGDMTRARADSGDVLIVHYHGWLTDGTLFDSSIIRQQPYQFLLSTDWVIDGWVEGIEGMYLGGERQIVIPPELAYGEQGFGEIPPNATLIFEVALLGAQ